MAKGMKSEELKQAEEECVRKYGDILNLPAHVSPNRVPMSMYNRAAQFMPFDALAGYKEAQYETVRTTVEKRDLSSEEQEILNENLTMLYDEYPNRPVVKIVYFEKDPTKSGGSYETITATLRQVDPANNVVILKDRRRIRFSDLLSIEKADD